MKKLNLKSFKLKNFKLKGLGNKKTDKVKNVSEEPRTKKFDLRKFGLKKFGISAKLVIIVLIPILFMGVIGFDAYEKAVDLSRRSLKVRVPNMLLTIPLQNTAKALSSPILTRKKLRWTA